MEDLNCQTWDSKLLGGRLCLDFANTVDWHESSNPQEKLNSYADLALWSKTAGILTEAEVEQLLHEASKRPSEVQKILERAIELREAIFRIFSSLASQTEPSAGDLSVLNSFLAETMSNARIVRSKDGFTWDFRVNRNTIDRMLSVIARSAAELLVSDELKRLKKCCDQKCGWLFLDISKNRSRRWCDMRDCGNRAKAKRHYRRKHLPLRKSLAGNL